MAASPTMRADDWELRCHYNRELFFERWTADEFRTVFGEPGTPAPESGQPPNTISQTAYHYDRTTNDEVAKVHFFLLQNGDFGGSGRPDPKKLLIGSIRYR